MPNSNFTLKDLSDYVSNNPDLAHRLLQNLQLAGGLKSIADNNGIAGGGRIGMNIPLDNANLNVGVSGGGYKVGKYSDFGINNLDAQYQSGNNTIGGNYSPQDSSFNLYYRRKF